MIRDVDPGSEFFPIPDPRVKFVTGSRIRIHNTEGIVRDDLSVLS
jgi:hypothetical protein